VVCLATVVLTSASSPSAVAAEKLDPATIKFFETNIRPLFIENCHKCHAEKKQKGELRLDSRQAILKGGDTGPAIVAGNPAKSLLIEAARYGNPDLEMPPKGKLKDKQIAALEQWIKMGAPWPKAGPTVAHGIGERQFTEKERSWWAYQPVTEPKVPQAAGSWARNAIDQFIFTSLKAQGLEPAGQASRTQLIRRAYFDLHGLPPTPAQIEAFVNDQSPDAYEKLIDRLLQSPRYGEHWARHWLDLVRYAESDGYKQDGYRPHAWRYRDYVINAFNSDKSYKRFVLEQLAGDEIAPDDPDAIVATGYLRGGIYEYNQRDVETHWASILNEITDVTADVFLATGMGCARCHDHKFDPLLQKDYFRLQAFFTPILWRDDLQLATPDQKSDYNAKMQKWRQATADIRKQIDAIRARTLKNAYHRAIIKFHPDLQAIAAKTVDQRTPYERQVADFMMRQVVIEQEQSKIDGKIKGEPAKKLAELRKQLAKFNHLEPKPYPKAFTVTDVGPTAPPTMIPDDASRRQIDPGIFSILDPKPLDVTRVPTAPKSTGRRTALAQWIARDDNPLSTRVIVNRLWHYHFGRGIVPTPSDFGHLGEKPSHPQLLDWLTTQFIKGGWKLKPMHKLMMMSAAYRQTALRPTPQIARMKDPGNRLLWRMNVRRLGAEQIRDAMLAVSGQLNLRMGGAGESVTSLRRSIYTKVLRNTRDPFLAAFDAPDAFGSTPMRSTTTTPTQALLLINGDWVLKRSRAMAGRLLKDRASSDNQRLIADAFELAMGHEPDTRQVAVLTEYFNSRVKPQPKTAPKIAAVPSAKMPGRKTTAAVIDPQKSILAVADNHSLPSGDFTVEGIVLLKSLYPDATVRTIVSQWNSNTRSPGWSFGVTSTKSKYQPRNLILQMVGGFADGKQRMYEVIASNLRPQLNKPYYLAVSVQMRKTANAVTFYMKDLSSADAPLQTAMVEHKVNGNYRANLPVVIGGRHSQTRHKWDGLIDELRISGEALKAGQLLINNPKAVQSIVAHWRFEGGSEFLSDASKNGNDIKPGEARAAARSNPRFEALVDLCHILLNSNEFIYVD